MPEMRLPEVNSVSLAGRLTRDSELRFTQAGAGICSFSLAVNRRYKDKGGEWKDDTSFVNATIFGKLAESISDRLKKGAAVLLDGRLKSNKWKDKDGNERSGLDVICDRVQVLSKSEAAAKTETSEQENTEEAPF